jgi:hypothetical protein
MKYTKLVRSTVKTYKYTTFLKRSAAESHELKLKTLLFHQQNCLFLATYFEDFNIRELFC